MKPEQEMFEAFWAAYPRRLGKGAARSQFAKSLKLASFETIMDGLIAQLSTNLKRDDPQFIPHARTWLSQERWADDIEQPKQRPGIVGAVMREMENARQNQNGVGGYAKWIPAISKH